MRPAVIIVAGLVLLVGAALAVSLNGGPGSNTAGGDNGVTRVDAPGTRVESDDEKTRIQAPGVDITVPTTRDPD